MSRVDILGVGFDAVTEEEAALRALSSLSDKDAVCRYIVTPNPEIVQICRHDEAVAAAVRGAYLVLPDGIGILYAAKILGKPLAARVPGIDFAERLLAELAAQGKSVYLLGAKPGVAEAAARKLAERFPGLVIAGTRDGYFTQDELVLADMNANRPDVLFVCLGAPKQELWMETHCAGARAKLMLGLGGALDVWSGAARRAPRFMRRLGLEWLYRLVREPRRITRMLQLPLFLCTAVAARLRGG